MIKNCLEAMQEDLDCQIELANELESKLKKLDKHSNQYLVRTYTKGHSQFHLCTKEGGKEVRKYLGKQDCRIVLNFQEYKFIEEALRRCRINIAVLSKAVKNYACLYPADIVDKLPSAYKNIEIANKHILGIGGASEWLSEMQAIKDSSPIYYPEALVHRASNGIMMRSKSECIISDILYGIGIPYIYELPLHLGEELFIPDFTCLNPKNGQTIIIEFFGMMDNQSYRSSAYEKIDRYMQGGYIINKNFIPIFDDLNGNIDVQLIRKILLAAFE